MAPSPPPAADQSPGPGPGPAVAAGDRRILAGTSGFAFSEWKPEFYPPDLPNDRFLSHYAARLPTVEINVSFYRMPTVEMLEAWKAGTPSAFRFAIKAHRRITHQKRLRDVDQDVRWLHERAGLLGERLGPILFQLPPSFKQDLPLLEQFLVSLPPLPFVAVEFRHKTWHDEATYALLKKYGAAMCIAEDEESCEPLVHTAPFGYYRLHRLRYTDEQLARWAEHLRETPQLRPVFCYFTHETGPEAVTYARRLMDLLAAAG